MHYGHKYTAANCLLAFQCQHISANLCNSLPTSTFVNKLFVFCTYVCFYYYYINHTIREVCYRLTHAALASV